MKPAGKSIKSLFFGKNGNTMIAFLGLLSIALILAAISFGSRADWSDFKKFMPRPSDLATSPLARDLPRENKNPAEPAEPAESAENRPAADEADKANVSETIGPEAAVAVETEPELKPVVEAPTVPATAPDAARADMVIIPKIGVNAPVITPRTKDAAQLKKLLDSGAVIYPDSPVFGAAGQTIVLGHSAPPNWPKIKHDTIFSRIAELSAGDKIIVVYNDRTYNYSVSQGQIIEKGGAIPATASDGNSLALVTCWPPGRDLKRMVVQAQLASVE
jgi:LPXTG-site transpeptidase (sortase) family protein